MAKPKAMVLTGFGINCDEETKFALTKAGADVKKVHLQDLIDGKRSLHGYHILAIPGGFSFGDDIASGKIFEIKMKTYLGKQITDFAEHGSIIGICNGAQIATKFGLLPGLDDKYDIQLSTLANNDSGRFECRWVKMKNYSKNCIFTRDIGEIEMPVAHGEGKFVFRDDGVLKRLYKEDMVVFKYVDETGNPANGKYPYNPNGSTDDIAAICDPTGRLMAIMPHPERYLTPYHHPQWKRRQLNGELPYEGQGLKIFKNIVEYFQ